MVLWQVSIVTMALVVWGTHGIQVKVGERGWPLALFIPTEIPYATGIIYNCFQRVGWSLSLSWIIFSCTKGYGGNVYLRIIYLMIHILVIFFSIFNITLNILSLSTIGLVNDFLSWGFFAPLSRLTFFMYLIHLDFERMFYGSMDYTYDFTNLQMVS